MSNSTTCYYCLKEGHNGKDCFIFSVPIANCTYSLKPDFGFKNKELIYKLLWQVSQEKNCMLKIQQIIKLAKDNKVTIDLTIHNNMMFRNACYQNDIKLAEYLLKMEPKINVRDFEKGKYKQFVAFEFELVDKLHDKNPVFVITSNDINSPYILIKNGLNDIKVSRSMQEDFLQLRIILVFLQESS
jgi:hypothetical protein